MKKLFALVFLLSFLSFQITPAVAYALNTPVEKIDDGKRKKAKKKKKVKKKSKCCAEDAAADMACCKKDKPEKK